MEVSTQKSKFTTNSTNNISADISVNGQKLEEITSFTCARMAPAQHQDCLSNDSNGHTKPDLEVNTVSCTSKFKLYNSLFTTILSSSLAVKHGPSMLTLKKRIQAFETKCLRKLFRISYLDHKTNDWVQSKINFLVDPQERLLATVKRQKLAWFGHVTRHDNLSKTILQGTMEGGRHHGCHRKCWMDNVKGWTSLLMPELLTRASCRKDWKRIYVESSHMSLLPPSPAPQLTHSVKGLN